VLRNSDTAYGFVSKCLHWVIAVLIIALVGLGWYMVDLTYYDRWYNTSLNVHKSLGLIALVLATVKLGWQFLSPPPAPAESLNRLERMGARGTHLALYGMMLVVPVSGYLISTSAGDGVSVFAMVDVPALLVLGDDSRDLAIEFHYYLAYTTFGLAAIHAFAALKHQFIDRDQTLRRMLWRPRRISR
jgi:cytochrome b561